MAPFLTGLLLDGGGHLRSGWRAVLFLLAGWFATAFLALPLVLIQGLSGLDLLKVDAVATGLMALGFLLASWLAVRLERRPLRSLGLGLDRRWALEGGIGILAGLLIMVSSALLLWGLDGFHWVPAPRPAFGAVLSAGMTYTAVSVAEELTFRGYGLQRVVRAIGPLGGQAAFALLFALAHAGNPGIQGADGLLRTVALLNIGLAGLVLGLAWQRTGSLALPMGIHLGWNWAQESLLGFRVSGGSEAVQGFLRPFLHDRPTWLTGGAVGLEGSVACTAVCGVALAVLLAWRGRRAPEAGA